MKTIEHVDPAAAALPKGRFYLDADATGVRSRYVIGGRRAIETACAALNEAGEGQVGIYRSYHGDGFFGYVIKYPGQSPVWESAPE